MEVKVKKFKSMIVVAGLLVISLVVISCLSHVFSEKKVKPEEASKGITVKTQKAKWLDSLNAPVYKVSLEPYSEAEVSCIVAGRVNKVFFENGSRVRKGQMLLKLDDTSFQNKLRTAKLELEKLQIDADSKTKQFEGAKTVFETGASSKSELDDGERSYKTALLECELKKVEIQSILQSIEDCAIKAEIDGDVVEKSINVGQFISPGSTYARIKNNAYIKAKSQLFQSDLSALAVGQTVKIGLSEFGDRPYQGIVETISKSANSQTRGFDCVIVIDNRKGKLNSGISGYMEITQKSRAKVLVVPFSAVVGSQNAYAVYSVQGGKAIQIPIKTGKISSDWIEVTSGLKEGASVIVTNASSLQSGDLVQVSGGQ